MASETCSSCGCCSLVFVDERSATRCAGSASDPTHCTGWAGVTSYPLPPCPECGGAIMMPPARCVGRCASSDSLDATATRAVLDDVLDERRRQHARWGQQDLPDGTGVVAEWDFATLMRRACETAFAEGRGTWRHILEEEIAEAMDETDDECLETELIQVAAVAVQWVEAIRRRRSKADVDAAVRAQLGGGR